jgi:hypothetical protein
VAIFILPPKSAISIPTNQPLEEQIEQAAALIATITNSYDGEM